jgi:pimeloyl-ACP methyl ester carboxylesterase
MTPTPKTSVSTEKVRTFASAHTGAEAGDVECVYLHATGFCKELWTPVVRHVESAGGPEAASAMLVDQRGHGDSTPFTGSLHWDAVAQDLVQVLSDVPGPIFGIGHSGGAAAVARAEILSPGTFSTIVLIEPIVNQPPFERRDLPLAVGAEKRTRSFSSRSAARQRFSNGPFGTWDSEVLDLYADHAFRPTDDGWTLKCEPTAEAEVYRQGSNVDTWNRLSEIECGVVVVTADESDSHQDPYRSLLIERFRSATSVILEGVGHLAPMEAPEVVGDAIAYALSGDGRREASGTIA